MKKQHTSGSKWEEIVGYSRATRIGNTVEISGTTAYKGGKLQGGEDPYHQALTIFGIIDESLEALGAKREDVVRTRMYVTNIAHWRAVSKAHQEYYGDICPATTMVEVSALIEPDMLVEIEATAVISD